MKKTLIVLFYLSLLACQSDPKVIKRDGQPDVSLLEADNSKMNNAIKLANKTLGKFDLALLSNDTKLRMLSIKARFATPDGGGEHIWLSDIAIKDNQYHGVIANVPFSTKEVKLGDTVMVTKAQISDWKYIQNGKLIGGYTIRVSRNQLSEADKKVFDQENGYDVE